MNFDKYILTCNYKSNKDIDFHHPTKKKKPTKKPQTQTSASLLLSFLLPLSQAATDVISISIK